MLSRKNRKKQKKIEKKQRKWAEKEEKYYRKKEKELIERKPVKQKKGTQKIRVVPLFSRNTDR